MRRRRFDLHTRLAVFRRDGYRCQHCGHIGTWLTLEVDHIIPVALMGDDEFDNLQALCRPCNRRKGARFIG